MVHRFSKLLQLVILITTIGICEVAEAAHQWRSGIEGQRKADLGNGFYLNPILSGDRPDPSILKHGDDYYLVNSSFESAPALMIWHSKDLVNWEPVGPALDHYVGAIWAPDLTFCNGRFYLYFPVLNSAGFTNMVLTATDINGPWDGPVDLHVGNFDPGHAVSADGKHYLFFNGGTMARLSDDGLRVAGPMEHVYDGWPIPDCWQIEAFSQEGPKIMRHGDYYYMVLAEGGTAGPATSHMVIMARAKSLEGPWENSPYNPVVHTASADEKWWSRGHGTLVEGPDGKQWYLVYHAYENGFKNLGRQTLLEPVEWTPDGWVKACGYDVAKPIPMPAGGTAVANGQRLSDDFSTNRIGTLWSFFHPHGPIAERYRYENGALILKADGTSPKNTSPLQLISGDNAYEIEAEIDKDTDSTAGLLLYYSERLFTGFAFSGDKMIEYGKGEETSFDKPAFMTGNHFFIRIRNDRNFVSFFYSADGKNWTEHWMHFEVSCYQHNTVGGFLSLRPSLMAAGNGDVRFIDFKYKALP